MYRVMFRYEEEYSWRYEGVFYSLWKARRYVKKQIKKDSRVVKKYDKYVEYWP